MPYRARDERARPVTTQIQKPWQSSLGVSASVSVLNLVAFLLHSSASIVFLVFLNATQPFLIAQLDGKHGGEVGNRQGSLSGTLVFADESLSIFLALIWGSLADVIGTKYVAVIGYCFISIALFTYTFAQNAWPQLLYCRLIFAVGGSSVTAMLTGILNSYSATFSEVRQRTSVEDIATETEALLGDRSNTGRGRPKKQSHGRLAALAGLTTGFGALLAVFVLLRLPTILAGIHDQKDKFSSSNQKSHDDEAIRQGTKEAFYIVAILALLVAAALSFGLKMDAPSSKLVSGRHTPSPEELNASNLNITQASTREARRQRLRSRLQRRTEAGSWSNFFSGVQKLAKGVLAGFRLAGKDGNLPLAYIGGGLARASTIATTVFIPVLVTRFFYSSGLCSDLSTPDVPNEELKKRCRQAFTVASILSGVIQLVALLLAPLIGYLCDAFTPSSTLFLVSLVGTISYLVMGTALPNDGDPRTPVAWVAAVGIGFAQIGVIVASLALCARGKANIAEQSIKSAQAPEDDAPTNEDIADDAGVSVPIEAEQSSSGAIAGAYSATGGLSILLVSKLGGLLSDLYAPAPFLLMSGLAAVVTLASLTVMIKEKRKQRIE
ncbi:MFS general substrate transporter [Meira miltonrushii]|uniref:MFS general substrate transporter n=1 Tax=Meira miltonrushii TaxID=1280837 RepID=A0A316VCN7_9BASI|nr:MFS general substrate transporter [Meira miltonrushii]PWN34888.1 MFS general substrate transporter [Meira miltonrushii]